MRKVKHLEELHILPKFPQIDKTLFRKMLTTWTRLQILLVYNPAEQAGQHLLEQMQTGCWSRLKELAFNKKPEDLKFVTGFKNLKSLVLGFNLPREETMYLIRACLSLHHIHFQNPSTYFDTLLCAKTFCEKYCNVKEILCDRHSIDHRRLDKQLSDRYVREFDSLDQLVDHYYHNDFFNRRRFGL